MNACVAERDCLKLGRAADFDDGARCAFLRRFDGARERGGFPPGFHGWPLGRRNAWFAGFNVGFHDRIRFEREQEMADG